ncbi:MAG: ComEC/Rec2 family competence protein [Actinomycetota bacterium]|nr:ComEC/Rec2 family competence protein [Actinomycetota bacterium]
MAVWAGSIVVLLAGVGWFTTVGCWCAGTLAAIGLTLLASGRSWRSAKPWRAGWAVAMIGAAAGLVIAGVALVRAADDPLTAAAAHGHVADMTVEIDATPILMHSAFGIANDVPEAVPATQYRIAGTVRQAAVAGQRWDADSPISILAAGSEWRDVVPGQQIMVSGVLRPDDFPVIPAVQMRTTAAPVVTGGAPWWSAAAASVRSGLKQRSAVLGGDAAGLLPGLVVGDTGGIDDRLTTDAKTTGLTHLVAVSGSHFALVCGGVILLLRQFGRRIAAAGGTAVLLGLVVLVGPQPSVLRAAVMGGIGISALLIGRARTALPALAAAVIALLLVDPALALGAGFALSVLATAGLVLLAPRWSKTLRGKGWPPGWADLVSIPLAASVMTLPVIALLSGAVSIAGIPANILVAPVVPIALIIGLLCGLVGPLWAPVGNALARADGPFLRWIAWVAHSLARMPQASFPWPATVAGVLGLAGALVAVMGLLRRRRLRALAGAALAGVAVVLVPAQVLPPVGWPPPGWLLAGCEVGQGDAFVLSTDQRGTAVVVDTGPDPQLMDHCLDGMKIGTIPLLVLTHLHADHVDGLAGAIDGRSVGMVGVGPDREPAGAWKTVVALARSRGIPMVELTPGSHWAAAGLSLAVLAPAAAYHGTDSDPNNDSVVMRAEHAGVTMLMAGDIETEAQQALLDSGVDLRADVLKVPHHGSAKDLPAFLQAVAPKVALIGVGLHNDYGHPSPQLLQRLKDVGVSDVLRTDIDGDIATCLIDGHLEDARLGATLRGP